MAASPSPRPGNPRPFVLVPRTDTADSSTPRRPAIRDRIERMRSSLGAKVDEVEVHTGGGRRRRGRGGRLPRPKR